jgi:hypothetical protein
VAVIAVPIFHRRQIVGCVLACGLTEAFFNDESLARFCSLHQTDRLVCERMASAWPQLGAEQLAAYAGLLEQQVGLLGTSTVYYGEIQDLSSHLAQAYEELNLIYRISTSMTVSKQPAFHFSEACRRLLMATAVEGFATILEPPEMPVEPSIVMEGTLRAAREDIRRLYCQVRDHKERTAGMFVVSDARSDPAFAWATPWLDRFVCFTLSTASMARISAPTRFN